MNDHSVPSPQTSLLRRYRDLLLEANQSFNLTSVRDAEGVGQRHIAESLALARALDTAGRLAPGARVIDVGSGGGVPGIPLAIVRPDTSVTLLEATGKKSAFLERAVHQLGLPNVRVLNARAETAAHEADEREAYDLALARAVAPLATLVELTLPFVRIGGALAAVKGSRTDEELANASGAITRCGGGTVQAIDFLPEVRPVRLLLIAKRAPTPPELPRRPGIPGKRPLR